MEMQPEAESYVGQVVCGGAARRVDSGVLSELRRRARPEADGARVRAASASLAAGAMPVAGFAPAEAESENDLDARRKTLRRRDWNRRCVLGVSPERAYMACGPAGSAGLRRR